MLHILLLLVLAFSFFFGRKRPIFSVVSLLSLTLLLPPTIKFNLGIGLNSFLLSLTVLFLVSWNSIRNSASFNSVFQKSLTCYGFYLLIVTSAVQLGVHPFSEYVQNIVKYDFFSIIVLPYALCFLKLDGKDMRLFNLVLVICSSIIVVYGLFCYYIGINPYMTYINIITNQPFDMTEDFMNVERGFLSSRVSSTFAHPLQLGQFSLLLATYILFELEYMKHKKLLMLLVFGLFVMIVMCGSRSAIFPIFISFAIYALKFDLRRILKYGSILFFALIVGFSSLPSNTKDSVIGFVKVWDDKAASKGCVEGSSVDSRATQYSMALEIINDREFFGRGLGYVENHGKNYPGMYGYESIFLKELVNGGFVGLLVFILFYFFSYYQFWLSVKEKDRLTVHAVCLSFFVSIVLTGIMDQLFPFYMLICFAVYYNSVNRHKRMTLARCLAYMKERKVNTNSI